MGDAFTAAPGFTCCKGFLCIVQSHSPIHMFLHNKHLKIYGRAPTEDFFFSMLVHSALTFSSTKTNMSQDLSLITVLPLLFPYKRASLLEWWRETEKLIYNYNAIAVWVARENYVWVVFSLHPYFPHGMRVALNLLLLLYSVFFFSL